MAELSDRQRNYSDSRYNSGNSDLSRYRQGSYDVTTPRYRSRYGYSDRDTHSLYPDLTESLYPGGNSMSKYTRSYDTNNKNYDISGKSYDSQRLYDRGKFDNPDVGAPKFEFGINYNAASRAQDTASKSYDTPTSSYDTSTRDYDTGTGSYDVTARTDDVTRRSPARTASLSDRNRNQPAASVADAPYERPSDQSRRQRLNSGESSGSVSSEKSDDRSLLNVLKNRYKENAERQSNDPVTRAPFSTWRRSGHYDDVASSTAHDGDKDKAQPKFDKSESLEKTHSADSSLSKRDSHHEDRSHKETTAESRPEPSPDDLLYNFRSALRRHQLSEHDKEDQGRKTADGESTSTAFGHDDMEEKLERLRAARAKLQEQKSSDKPRPQSFASEFRAKPEKVEEVKKPQEIETKTEKVPEQKHIMEPQKSTKLSRQKLVSDNVKAKFIESRKDENTDESQDENLARKRSSRRSKHKEHMEYWSKDQEKEKSPEAEKLNKTDSVPTVEEMLHGTKQADIAPSPAAKRFQNVSHSSPFGSVYTKNPTQQPSPSPSQSSEKEKSTIDSKVEPVTKTEVSSKLMHTDSESAVSDSKEAQSVKPEAKEKKSSGRKLKRYATKSKSLELGVLSKPEPAAEPVKVESQDDSKVGASADIDEETRLERINRYKEERKKQLAAISSRFDKAEKELPSLFLLGKAAEKDTPVQRSKSMKVEMGAKVDQASSSVARSKSLKHDRDPVSDTDSANMPKVSGLKYAEIGNQLHQDKETQEADQNTQKTEVKSINTEKIMEKLHALKKLREQHLKGEQGITIEELQNKRASKHMDDTSSIDSNNSYSSRTLLADRVEDSSSLNVRNRDRYRSSSTENPRSRESSRETTPKIRSFSEKSDTGLKSKLRTFSDRSDEETQGRNLFEFGTVYTKKDKTKENKASGLSKSYNKDRSRTPSEIDEESGRESVDSYSRIRRKLPSIEDVLGASDDELFDSAKTITGTPERESAKEREISPPPVTDKDISEIKGDEIQRKKVLDNIEKARSKFKDDGQSVGVFGMKYEMGTKFMPKQADKHREAETTVETVSKTEDKIDAGGRAVKSVDVETTRKEMLGYDSKVKEDKPPVVDSAETLSSVRKDMDPITGLYRVRQTGYKSKVSRTPSRETSEERITVKQEVPQVKKTLAQVKEKREERLSHAPETFHKTTEHGKVEEKGVEQEKDSMPPASPRLDRKLAIAAKFNKSSSAGFQFGTDYSAKKVEPPVKSSSQSEKPPVESSKSKSSVSSITLTSQRSIENDKKPTPTFDIKTSSIALGAGTQSKVSASTRMSPVRTVVPPANMDITAGIPVSSLVYQPPAENTGRAHPLANTTVSMSYNEPQVSSFVANTKHEPVSPFAYEPAATSKVLGGGKQTAQVSKPVSIAYEPQATIVKQAEPKKETQLIKPVSVTHEPESPKKPQEQPQESKPVSYGYTPTSTVQQIGVKKEPQVTKPVSFAYEPPVITKSQVEAKKEPPAITKPQIETKKESPAITKPQIETKREPEVKRPVSFPHEPEPIFNLPFGMKIQPAVTKPVSLAQEPAKALVVATSEAQISKPANISHIKSPATKQEEVITKPASFAYEPSTPAKPKAEIQKEPQVARVIPPEVHKASEKKEEIIPRTTLVPSSKKEPSVRDAVSSVDKEPADVKTSDESEKEPTVFNVQAGSKTEVVVLKPVTTPEVKELPSQTQYLEEVFEKAKEIEARKSEEDLTKSETDNVEIEHTVRASLTLEHKVKKRTEEEEDIAKEKRARDLKDKEDRTVAFMKVQDEITAKKKEMDKRRGRKLERSKSAKGKMEKSVLTKVRVESQMQDTSTLDDILDRNVEFLSDLEPPDFKKGSQGDKTSRQRVKRSLKKKSMKRSKSEDRSHFQIQDSDEDVAAARSRVTEDLRSTSIRLPRSRGDRAAAGQRSATSSTSDAIATDSKHGAPPQKPPGTSNITRIVSKNVDSLEPVQNNPPVTQSAASLQTGPGSRLTAEISQVYQSKDNDEVDMATIAPSVSVQQEAPVVATATATLTSAEPGSKMASDMSEVSDRRRYGRQSIDSLIDSESSKISDSDMSVSSSALSEGSRKRRKDKSSLRKSKLNESGEDAPVPSRHRESTESSRASRTSVRRVASSRLAREPPPPDKSAQKDEVLDVLRTHDIDISVVTKKNLGVSTSTRDGTGSKDKHLNNSDIKHVNNTDTTRVASKSALDTHSVLPSRFALPSKVSSAITRLSEASEKSSRESSPLYKKPTELVTTPRGLRRENNFNRLLQKFSGSETSSSEKSDTESPHTRKILLKRQGAYTASSESSDEVRRAPERTQSLRLRSTASPASDKDSSGSSVQRSASFKSDFMKRRFSPDPENRRRLPETPVEQSDKPSPELASVLNKRSTIVSKQQEEGAVIERQKIHDGRVEKAERYKEAKADEGIADSEVLQMLRSRRKETDSSVSESERKSQQPAAKDTSVPQSSTVITHKQQDTVSAATKPQDVQKTQVQAPKEVHKPKEEPKVEKQRLASQSSFESKTSITLSSAPVNKQVEPPLAVPLVKDVPKTAKAQTTTVTPKLDLSAIDTSLAVLNKVSASVGESEKLLEKSKLEKDLANVNLKSETEVVQFIKSVDSGAGVSGKTEKNPAPAADNTVQSSLPTSTLKEEEEFRQAGSPASTAAGTIDITSRSEIKKKFSAREVTPERQSPLRSMPMRVTSPMKAPGLSRTESMGRSESERPKGILKRTPSLKQTSGVNVDPELAEVLKSRRHKQSDDELEEQPKMTIEEEIKQQRELQSAKDELSEEQKLSVAERVFQMHNKIEEIRSCPITPRRSGFATPKTLLQLSGPGTPGNQYSFDEGKPQQELSGTQLIERLTSLEGQQAFVSEKRKRFQQARRQDGWRTRTQPVTLHEIQQADSLETVRKFRSEVTQKATVGLFEELEKEEEKEAQQKTEFPLHVKHERRVRGDRHKTLPITAAELNAIPEGSISGTTNTLKKKFESLGVRDSKGDSGILSGSDGDGLSVITDSHSMEEKIDENDPVKMSVSAKASMFHQIQESLKTEKRSASGAKRYIDRKKRERSRTLPITEDEVKLAAEIADKEEEDAKKEKEEAEQTTVTVALTAEEQEKSDELSRQSLKDKVKLFTTIEEEKKAAAQKKGVVPPPPKRRNKRFSSRFATQPVTFEEVEKAARISPLACSLVKPPDPDILSGLSVKDQRELIAKHAEKTLSQPGSRSGSRPTSRSTSITDLTEGILNKDSLTATNTEVNANIGDWEPSDRVRPSDVKGKAFTTVVKQEERKYQMIENIRSELDSNRKSILKSELEQKLSLSLHHDPKGILKPKGDAVPTFSDIKSILKKESSIDTTQAEVKSILKKEGSFETRRLDTDKSAMKPSDTLSSTDEAADTSDTLESDNKEPEGVESSGDNLDSDEGLLDAEDKTGASVPNPHRKSKDRRKFNRDRKLEAERYKTQPTESVASAEARPKKKYVGRHLTQPVTPDEKKEAEIVTATPEVKKTGSINDRLNALKQSGEEGWKKRVSRPEDLDALDRRSLSPPSTTPVVKMRDRKNLADTPRPLSMADRMSLLDNAQVGWRDRIGETDVKQFTIEHKISASGQPVGESPLVTRLKGRVLKKELSRESESSDGSELSCPSSPTKELSKCPMPREVVCADIPPELLKDDTKSPLATIKTEEEETRGPVSVEIPDVNAEMEHFFVKKEVLEKTHEQIEVSIDDFDELFMSSNDILETTRRIKPKRRQNPSSRNPMKTMSACLDIKTEYTEVLTGVAERELKRQKTAQISQNSGFAVEALAGLASKENFAKVALRKTDSIGTSRLEPYLPLMLIHIKGRRKVQCRLVEPTATSLNSGDCFVLITPDKNIMWCGDYCNVIEKAKAADFCDQVKQKKDLGCKGARDIGVVEEKKARVGVGRHFWELIGGQKEYQACGPPEEDELYENHIVETNMIYRMEENKLVPVEECWGSQPRYKMLQNDQVYVFDFGSEVYLWQGKAVSPNQRKISMKLAEQVWNKGYNYSECDINPLCPLRTEEEGGLPSVSDTRPEWALFGKVHQNMETILFREKFIDWPDTSRLIKVKSQEEVNPTKIDLADLKACDAKLMVPVNSNPVTTVLEGSNVGRGLQWEQDMDGFIQTQIVETLKVRVWHVLEYDHYEIEEHSFGQFHEGDTYVIRWQYMIVNAGMKNLKGQASRHSKMGRERCAYFFWQGKTSTINEKGASALMTVELDEERGPQVRVDEGKEPPCFLNLFKGRMIIHIGKREEEDTNTQGPWKFYCLRNEYENEVCLIEVPRDIANLRSVSSFLLLNVKTGRLIVWHGCKSPDHTKKLAATAAGCLKERCPLEVGLLKGKEIDISEVNEGEEGTDFWRVVNITRGDRSTYNSLLKNPESFSHTLRLFHMTSVSGLFAAQEILNPSRTPDLPTKFPVLQTDLYKASQPALFLIDNGHEVYLWQGWLPEGDENQENVLTGSAVTRLSTERKCAMETTIQYCKEINPENPPEAYLVYAGLEPLCFTNLFPLWTVEENVKEINLRDGKTDGEMVRVEDLLAKVSKTRYTLLELLEIPPPEGVDPLKMESYLSDEEFESLLEMTKEEFYALPNWKQSKMKQQAGLY